MVYLTKYNVFTINVACCLGYKTMQECGICVCKGLCPTIQRTSRDRGIALPNQKLVPCTQYRAGIKTIGGEHGGDLWGEFDGVVVVVKGQGQEIDVGRDIPPPNQKPSAPHSILVWHQNGWRGVWREPVG
jgi:hypothetical protein